MARYNPRYGLSGEDINRLHDVWYKRGLEAKGFGKFDDFVRWAIQTGYQPGSRMKRLDKGKPASPENSFWVARREVPENPEELADPSRNPCDTCEKAGNCWKICPQRARHWDYVMARIRRNLYGKDSV